MQIDKPKPPRKPPAARKFPPRRPPQKLIKIAQKLLAPALALTVVFGTAAAGSGDADYVLLIQGAEPICAKSRDTCETARRAILDKLWIPIGLEHSITSTVRCEPHPSCFPESSNHIRGFN